MVFASLTFLYLFLPVTLLMYFAVRNVAYRNLLLTAASLLFYAWGEPVWVTLLLLSSAFDYVAAKWIERHRGTRRAKVGLVASIVSNLGILGFFKYGGMVVESVNFVFGSRLSAASYGLPVGISFYTFQTLSYVIDVYRGHVPAARTYPNFLLFVSLFHQLVAGPIVRYVDVAREIEHRTHDSAMFAEGVKRLCIGLFKKVCFANVAGELVLRHLDAPIGGMSTADVWLGLVCHGLQLYYDFSGYSDMAIGLGMMNGFRYLENFNHPYVSQSMGEYWRRWHVSLGSFFRDYVYLPLGGRKRHGIRNLYVVWLLSGLWHGPTWSYVLWGLYQCSWVALERLGVDRLLAWLPRVFRHAYVIFVVLVGYILFHCESVPRILDLLRLAFVRTEAPLAAAGVLASIQAHAIWFTLAILFVLPVRAWVEERWSRLEASRFWLEPVRQFGVAGLQLAAVLVSTAQLVGRSYNPFLYFRY